jgi:serine/threonine protein kinase
MNESTSHETTASRPSEPNVGSSSNLEMAGDAQTGSLSVSLVAVPTAGEDRTIIAQAPIAGADEFFATGTVASLARVLIGQALDHYRLHELIGGGGMGAVFRASDTRLDREVAVKVIPNLGRDMETIRRFRVEAQSAAKLDHPHIARVYHVGETEAWSYIVFEYVEGINIRDLVIREGPLSIDDAVCYTVQVAEALQHASERSIVHRDIKPSNVLVTRDGFVKVVDMGLARTTTFEQSTRDLTASGVTLGTFDYISPEQARDPRSADVRSDLYSLGCTLYFMLTGQPPFAEGTAFQKLLMHSTQEPDDPTDFRDDLSLDLVAIIRKLMAKRPADRYQTAADLVSDLAFFAEEQRLPHARDLSGIITAPSVATRSLFDAVTPWLVGLIMVLGSTWWLYMQHRIGSAIEIPRDIVTTEQVLIEDGLPSVDVTAAKLIPSLSPKTELNSAEAIVRPRTSTIERPMVGPATIDESNANSAMSARPDNAENGGLATTTSTAQILCVQPFENLEARMAVDVAGEHRWFVGSLIEAIHEAERNTHVEEIWLDDDVWILDQPVVINRASLLIKSVSGRRARIEVRPLRPGTSTDPDSPSDPVVASFSIPNHQLLFDDIDLAAYPPTVGRGDYRFAVVGASGSVRLLRSTLTLMPGSSAWQVAAFGEMATPSVSTDSPTDRNDQRLEPLQILLENVVVRGEGNLLDLKVARRTELSWQNGLLSVSGWFLDTGGATDQGRAAPTIRLDLGNVTVVAEKGFARIRQTTFGSLPVYLSRIAAGCAFLTGKGQPLVEHENDMDSASEWSLKTLTERLDFRGNDNAYDVSFGSLIRRRSADGVVTDLAFGDDLATFFSERAPEMSIRWLGTVPPTRPWEQQTAADYLQRDGSFRPGFQPEDLPNH